MFSFQRMIAGVAAVACLALSACAQSDAIAQNAPDASQGPIVRAPAGAVEGRMQGAIRVFQGIPYAAPPVGQLRWAPPVPAPRWDGVRATTEYGPSCVQRTARLDNIYVEPLGPVSEDCLSLNIWAPADARDAPVFFWIHGGALSAGASGQALYDGAALARQGIVVVSINYRIGILGYFSHPELSAQSPDGISGNQGLLDQIEALRWVQRNIAAFGGDPANVTIAGESAGALSVMYLMAAPPAQGLFAKAISQSGYMISTPELREAKYNFPSAENAGLAAAATLQAPDLAALRAIDAQALVDRSNAAGYAPWGVVDGKNLTDQLVAVFERGEQARVPLLVGFNSGEIRSLRILAPPPPASAADYERIVRERYGDLADDFLRLYPSDTMQESIWATTRDALYGWTSERMARNQTAIGAPAYLYLWDHGYPAADDAGLHAFHASELPYMFDNLDRTTPNWPKPPETPEEARLADALVSYWANFARSGAPTAPGQPDWPAYGAAQSYMHFTDAPQPSADLYPGMLEMHEAAVCRRRAANLLWGWNVGMVSPVLANQPQCE